MDNKPSSPRKQPKHEEGHLPAEVALARLRLFLSPPPAAASPALVLDQGDIPPPPPPMDESSVHHHQELGSEITQTLPTPPPLPPTKGQVATVRPISSCSREFLRVKYLLQASLPEAELVDASVQIWDMTNPDLVCQYRDYTSSNFLELESWVNVHDLAENSDMRDVYRCGFSSPRKSARATKSLEMKFTTGNIPLTTTTAEKKKQAQFVLCKIGVGRSFVIEESPDSSPDFEIPRGYDSIYLRRGASSSSPAGYVHEYVLPDSRQVLPQYLVQFQYGPVSNLGASNGNKICGLCETKPASVFCTSHCQVGLCAQCDRDVHSANKLVSKHTRVSLKDLGDESGKPETPPDSLHPSQNSYQALETIASAPSTCPKHADQKVEFYCPTCVTPVCVHCKMIGDHSAGEASQHRLVPLRDAYRGALKDSQRRDPLLDTRVESIAEAQRALTKSRANVEANAEAVERRLRQMYELAHDHLMREKAVKLAVVSSEERELIRQQQQLEWADGFLAMLRRTSNAVDFLSHWNQHKLLRTELREVPTSTRFDVNPDLHIVGSLDVRAGAVHEGSEGTSSGVNVCTTENNNTPGSNLIMQKLLSTKTTSRTKSHCSILSPKSSQLLAQVKLDLASSTTSPSSKRHQSTTLKPKPRTRQAKRPSAGTLRLDGLALTSTKLIRKGSQDMDRPEEPMVSNNNQV